jgi:hypothetical protein
MRGPTPVINARLPFYFVKKEVKGSLQSIAILKLGFIFRHI